MSKRKTNPRDIPRTEADVRRARRQGQEEGTKRSVYIMLYVLADKLGFRDEQAAKTWMLFKRAVDEVNEGKLKWQDIERTLKDEYGYDIEI